MSPKPHTPASMRVRRAVRQVLNRAAVMSSGAVSQGEEDPAPLVLVALSGGADSLALAAAVAAEAPKAGVRAGAVVVDHGLQEGSAGVAIRAAEQARGLGLAPVSVRLVEVSGQRSSLSGGPEAAARSARYEALAVAAAELGARTVLMAHTRDDQTEQVLLALARGSGTRSIAAIPPQREIGPAILLVRPLLDETYEVTRETTETSCRELGIEPWHDPHNADRSYARVRVRHDVLPMLEQQLGPGLRAGLARSADLAREDANALDAIAEEQLALLVTVVSGESGAAGVEDSAGTEGVEDRCLTLPVAALAALPAAIRGRVIRLAVAREFGSQLTREHTLAIASLVTGWRGQGPIHAPLLTVTRESELLVFRGQ